MKKNRRRFPGSPPGSPGHIFYPRIFPGFPESLTTMLALQMPIVDYHTNILLVTTGQMQFINHACFVTYFFSLYTYGRKLLKMHNLHTWLKNFLTFFWLKMAKNGLNPPPWLEKFLNFEN